MAEAVGAGPLLALRTGWPAAAVGTVLACGTMAVIGFTASDDLAWLAWRLAAAGFAVYLVGVFSGSQRIVGAAAAPMLVAAVVGVEPAVGLPWGRALAVGCLWFVALESGWGSIEHRHGARIAGAVTRQRVREVATVVLVAALVGGAAMASATVAPTRTLLVRSVGVALVLAALTVALQQLRSATTGTGAGTGDHRD